MANIRQYTSTKAQEGLHPSDIGVESYERAGRNIGASIHQAGEDIGRGIQNFGGAMAQHDTMNEVSKGAADSAALMDELSTQWNQYAKNADPNDPDTAKKWRENVLEPALEKFNQGFTTRQSQQWSMQMVDHMRQHFFEKTAADQSTLAGEAAVSNINSLQTHLSNMVAQDPTAVDTAHGTAALGVNAIVNATPNLTADTAAKIRTELLDKMHENIAQSAVVGAADRNPAAARSLLDSPSITDHLDETKRKTLNTYIDSQERASMSAQRQQEADMRRQQKEDVQDFQNKIVAQTIDPQGGTRLYPDYFKDVAKLAFMPQAGDLPRAMLAYGHKVQEENAKGIPAATDPHVYSDYKQRAALPVNDPHALTLGEVYQARANGMLSDHDFSMFRGWVNEAGKNPTRAANQKILDQFERGMKGYFTKSNMMTGDPQGDQRYMEFQQEAQQRFEAGIASGLKPYDLVSPSSANYIFKDGISKFQVTQSQSINAIQQRATGTLQPLPGVNAKPAVQWKPGMSMDDLDKALGGK